MNDTLLSQCNESELLWLARQQGLGFLKKDMPKELLVKLVAGEEDMKEEYLSSTSITRKRLQTFIYRHWGKTRSQLPGCDGKCTTYLCSEGQHSRCYESNKEEILAGL